MSLKHGLLGFLNYGSMTGYELDKAFKQSLNMFWKAQTSQIYRELTSMEKNGWLSSERVLQEDKPNKKIYSLTDQGRLELQTWLSTIQENEGIHLRNGFLMKLFFSGEKSIDENIKSFVAYRNDCEKALSSLSQTGGSIEEYQTQIEDKEKALYWGLTVEYGYFYYQMSIDWANQVIERLEKLK